MNTQVEKLEKNKRILVCQVFCFDDGINRRKGGSSISLSEKESLDQNLLYPAGKPTENQGFCLLIFELKEKFFFFCFHSTVHI